MPAGGSDSLTVGATLEETAIATLVNTVRQDMEELGRSTVISLCPSGSRGYWGFTEDGKLKPEKIAFSGLGVRALQRPSLSVDALGHLAICGDPLPAVWRAGVR